MPDSYQVNDPTRQISPGIFKRSEAGLPDDCFVFCCFNNKWKISPLIFDAWMRLLKSVEKSVLWLLQSNEVAGRVAASLLHAAGLPELITDSLSDYEALALELATDQVLLQSIRRKLGSIRSTCALFDADRFRRNLEAAYIVMWERWQRGERPRSFSIDADARVGLGSLARRL